MKVNIDRKVVVKTIDNKKLFEPDTWFIEEQALNGSEVSQRYFAKHVGVELFVEKLAFNTEMRLEDSSREKSLERVVAEEITTPSQCRARYKNSITGEMRPQQSESVRGISFFGCNRLIEKMYLEINESDSGQEKHSWTASVSKTYDDLNIPTFVSPDMIWLQIELPRRRFRHLASVLTGRSAISASVAVGMASGFYTQWLPDFPAVVKVLTDEIALEVPKELSVIPPRLSLYAMKESYGDIALKYAVHGRISKAQVSKQ